MKNWFEAYRSLWSGPDQGRRRALLFALFVFAICAWVGERFIQNHVHEAQASQKFTAIAQASNIRSRLESQLNSLLFLSSGLSSYLVVRNQNLRQAEIHDILKALHGSNPKIRNFGIAVGYRLHYIYPLEGNESAVGLYYPDQKSQWPVIERTIREGKPVLDGPLDLVQGGRGLVFRSPIFIEGHYWGLLSTVINAESLFAAAFEGMDNSQIDFALKRDETPTAARIAVYGDMAVFDDPGVVTQSILIPGGRWTVGVISRQDGRLERFARLARLTIFLVSCLVAWAIYSNMLNRIRLSELALYDRLTGLANRNLLQNYAKLAFSRCERRGELGCAILFFDLDGFKSLNDTYGHDAGDTALRVTAARAKSVLRATDVIARWGGDEFIVLLEDSTPEGVEALKARLRSAIEKPIQHKHREIGVGVSIGLAWYPAAGEDLDAILRVADARMYEDKRARKQAP
ncbi:sensor domain-containing diguanylate cyclase [Propionivibrio dicarboxylicus]|uniref:Diguanylate cyclase (GGDEF) domain-containing protein n=1 Tax=Propionivibrio dicarboxylicus TaxID=83767 RepID=A0A1G8HZ35_9RHOO|nr:diguanylate cyclase [Propionivibrio dicarboxylicus]SDI11874.1 diguanylate cyclase (GGDEF) domain-containing protein [Propionivibrio dicarboxylicus]